MRSPEPSTQFLSYLPYLRAKIIENYPHLFGGHEKEVRVNRAMGLVGFYHGQRRSKKVAFEAEEDLGGDLVVVQQSRAEHLQSQGPHNPSPSVSDSSFALVTNTQGETSPSMHCTPVTNTPGETDRRSGEKDTLMKFLESCDPPMVCWREPLVAFGCKDLETLRLLVDCDEKDAILQQVADGARLKKALTQIHILFLLRNLGFPLA